MTAQELRVGNLVATKDKNTLAITDGIHLMGEMTSCKYFNCEKWALIGLDDLQPIPLSDDWLRRLGFVKAASCTFERQFYKHSLHYAYVTIPNGENIFSIGDRYSAGGERITVLNAPVEYVHQLQNLFFALTGEELKLKEE